MNFLIVTPRTPFWGVGVGVGGGVGQNFIVNFRVDC